MADLLTKTALTDDTTTYIKSNGLRTITGAQDQQRRLNVIDTIDRSYGLSYDNSDLTSSEITITHGLGSLNVIIQVINGSGYVQGVPNILIQIVDANNVKIKHSESTITGTYTVIIKRCLL